MTPSERSYIDHIAQGRVKTQVFACSDPDSLWVEVRRHNGKPWTLSPSLARGFAEILRNAADAAEARDSRS